MVTDFFSGEDDFEDAQCFEKKLINVLFRYATVFQEVKFSKIPKMTDFVRFQLKILGLN